MSKKSGPLPQGTCLKCTRYDPTGEDPCVWKIEAELDHLDRKIKVALGLIRRITARKRVKLGGDWNPAKIGRPTK